MTDSESDAREFADERIEDVSTLTHTTSTWKVLGEFADADGAGVLGHNTATSGAATGVEGVADALGDTGGVVPRGVEGRATGASVTFGVYGRGTSPSSQAVLGDASKNGATTLAEGFPTGVQGVTDRSSLDPGVETPRGVAGFHTATTGTGYGVYGASTALRDDGYGVYAAGNSKTTNDHEVGGRIRQDALTRAYLSSTQGVTSGSEQDVELDSTSPDEPGAFDTTNHVYTCPKEGHYRAEMNLRFQDTFGSESSVSFTFSLTRSSSGNTFSYEWQDFVVGGQKFQESFVQTFPDLNPGDTIKPRVFQDSGSGKDLLFGLNGTALVIRYLGTGLP